MSEKRISRRDFLKAAALTGGALGLAACSSQATEEPMAEPTEEMKEEEAPLPEPDMEPTDISFWYYWGGIWGDAMTQIATTFNENSKDVAVEATSTGGEWQKVLAALAAGTPPDVLLDFTGSQLIPRDQVLALDNLIETSSIIKKDNYYPAMLDSFSFEGTQYGLPAGEAGVDMALIINKGLAEEAGLDVNNPPQDLAEMLDWARKMTKEGDGGILDTLGFDPMDGTIGGGFYNYGALWGINWWDADSKTFNIVDLVEPIQWLADWVNEYGAVNFESFRAGFGGWLEPDSSVALGLQGMHINGYWTPGELSFKAAEGQEYVYTWVPAPGNRKGTKVQSSLPTGVFLPKPAGAPEAAFKFMEFLCSDDGNQIAFDNAGGFCWTKSFLEKVDVNKYQGLDFYVQSIAEADELYSNVQNCPLGWDFQFNQFLVAANSVIYDDKAPEDALQEAQTTCEDELEKLLRG